MKTVADQPLSRVEWVLPETLRANDYNPNVVVSPEFKLLKFSMLKQGWIQPLLVCKREVDGVGFYEIIDGFHRATLAKTDKDIQAMAGGLVPVCVLDIDEAERKMLTIRINRAKGSHVAVKMHDIIVALINEHGKSLKEVCEGIGADKSEIELLLTENVFKKLGTEDTPYSRAWEPKGK